MVLRDCRFLLWVKLGLAALAATGLIFSSGGVWATEPVEIRIAYLSPQPPPPPLYELEAVPQDEGLAGGELAVRDNNTTGGITGYRFRLQATWLAEGEDPVAKAKDLVAQNTSILALNLPAPQLLAVADALKGQDVLLFNVSAPDDDLRGAECRENLLHVAPSRAMLTDALAQFLAHKRWRKILLVVGPQLGDRLYAEAMKRSIKKFGLVLSAEKAWTFGPLARAKGDSPTTAEALVFTRGVDYDVALVADEAADWGDYLAYRTWDPR